MTKPLIIIVLTLLLVGIMSAGAVQAAVDNCSDCHHIDFQTGSVDRNTVCVVCHPVSHYGGFDTPNSINAGYEYVHSSTPYLRPGGSFRIIMHKGGTLEYNPGPPSSWSSSNPPTNLTTGCAICHYTDLTNTVRRVWCETCHKNVTHKNHGNVSYTVFATDGRVSVNNGADGHGYISRNVTCMNSNCHGNYATVKKPKCTNCHTDPHGSFPTPPTDQDFGVTVTPNTNPSYSDIAVKWLFRSGDTLKKGLDGINWTSIDIGSPAPGSYYTYTDTAVLNWTIVYYKITTSGGSEQLFPVYPPGKNAHMNYMENTEMCANCHVTHSAEQARLLKEPTIEDLCRTCHGLANTGSRYNVDTGEIVAAGSIDSNGLITATSYVKSNSGAFGIFSGGKYYAGSNAWGGSEVTSSHSTNSAVTSIAPGGGHNYIRLTCTSCHHSHPKKNSYRLLAIGNVQAFAVNPAATGERINYISKMNTGCGCHQRYIVDQNSGHVATDAYRHAVGVAIRGPHVSNNPITGQPWDLTTSLPTEYKVYHDNAFQIAGTLTGSSPIQYVENGGVFCLTCHYAHGTTATGSNRSSYDLNGDTLLNDNSTMLKRKSSDGACQDCHKR